MLIHYSILDTHQVFVKKYEYGQIFRMFISKFYNVDHFFFKAPLMWNYLTYLKSKVMTTACINLIFAP